MFIEQMRSYIRSVVEIDSSDIDDATLNRFLGEGYDQIVYSENVGLGMKPAQLSLHKVEFKIIL